MKTDKKHKVFIKTESKAISDLWSYESEIVKEKNLTGQARKWRDKPENGGSPYATIVVTLRFALF